MVEDGPYQRTGSNLTPLVSGEKASPTCQLNYLERSQPGRNKAKSSMTHCGKGIESVDDAHLFIVWHALEIDCVLEPGGSVACGKLA